MIITVGCENKGQFVAKQVPGRLYNTIISYNTIITRELAQSTDRSLTKWSYRSYVKTRAIIESDLRNLMSRSSMVQFILRNPMVLFSVIMVVVMFMSNYSSNAFVNIQRHAVRS